MCLSGAGNNNEAAGGSSVPSRTCSSRWSTRASSACRHRTCALSCALSRCTAEVGAHTEAAFGLLDTLEIAKFPPEFLRGAGARWGGERVLRRRHARRCDAASSSSCRTRAVRARVRRVRSIRRTRPRRRNDLGTRENLRRERPRRSSWPGETRQTSLVPLERGIRGRTRRGRQEDARARAERHPKTRGRPTLRGNQSTTSLARGSWMLAVAPTRV
eukprot:30935-Pelagococcus_subviridis.AAC.31